VPQPRHGGKHEQHGQVHRSGNRVSSGEVFTDASARQHSRQQKLCEDKEHEREGAYDDPAERAYLGAVFSDDVAGGENDGDEHERHFCEFSQPLTEAGDQERYAYRSEHEADTKHDAEIGDSGQEEPTATLVRCWMFAAAHGQEFWVGLEIRAMNHSTVAESVRLPYAS
jgi:hypothetical protein